LAALAQPGFDGREVVYVDPGVAGGVRPTERVRARIDLREVSAHQVVFTLTSSQPTVAVVAQSYYPSWRVRVNDLETPLLRANHAFQCVRVPAGTSQVVLTYDDRRFKAGVLISILSTSVCLGLIVNRRVGAGA
jgi:uncharacterized membrane protein YfhO